MTSRLHRDGTLQWWLKLINARRLATRMIEGNAQRDLEIVDKSAFHVNQFLLLRVFKINAPLFMLYPYLETAMVSRCVLHVSLLDSLHGGNMQTSRHTDRYLIKLT